MRKGVGGHEFLRTPDEIQRDHMDWGFRVALLYGTDYKYTFSNGILSYQYTKDERLYGFDPVMYYLDFYFPKFFAGENLRIGRYISIPDIEAQLAPNNITYSHSLLYTYDPYKIDEHWHTDTEAWYMWERDTPDSLNAQSQAILAAMFPAPEYNIGAPSGAQCANTSDVTCTSHEWAMRQTLAGHARRGRDLSLLRPRRASAGAQRRAKLDAIVLTQQRRDPVDEHPHFAREVPVLRVHDIQRRGLREPVTEHQLQGAALHRLLQNEGGNLRDPEPRFGRRHITVLVLEGDVAPQRGLHTSLILRENPVECFARAGREVVDAPMLRELVRVIGVPVDGEVRRRRASREIEEPHTTRDHTGVLDLPTPDRAIDPLFDQVNVPLTARKGQLNLRVTGEEPR
jgi:hypothetical protein